MDSGPENNNCDNNKADDNKIADNKTKVLDFIAACSACDMDKIMSFFDDTTVYHNIPLSPVTGVDSIRAALQPFFESTEKIDWVVNNIAETDDGVVLTERTDRFLLGDHWLELPVMGTFELEGDIIRTWRDYFDLAQLHAGLPESF